MIKFPPPKTRHRRRLLQTGPAKPVARIVGVTHTYGSELRVQFDQPVTVDGGSTTVVGAWIAHDEDGDRAPLQIDQVDGQTILLVFDRTMYSGTLGYTGGDPGAVTCANGFPDADESAYVAV